PHSYAKPAERNHFAHTKRTALDPISWTSSERWIRCPEWPMQRNAGARAGTLTTTSKPKRCASSWTTPRRYAVARDLDLTETALRTWVARARADRTQGKTGLTTVEPGELARLRKEHRILREEREIVKKAAAFFGNERRGKFAFSRGRRRAKWRGAVVRRLPL